MVASQNEFVIVPHVGVGPLRFGMLAPDVYQVLGQPSRYRGPGEFSTLTTEEFAAYNCFVEFDVDRRCRSVGFYVGAPALLDSADLMSMSYKNLVAYLRSKGASVIEEGDGFRCDDLGIACYASEVGDPEIPDARVECVLAYPRGYYDALDKFVATLRCNNDN